MKKIINKIDSLNKAQKIVLLFTLGFCFLFVALHNPFGGYYTQGEGMYLGSVYLGNVDLGFWNYKSRFAVADWIGQIGAVIGLLIPFLLFGVLAIWMLRSNND